MVKLYIRNDKWELKYMIHVVHKENLLNIEDFPNKINKLINDHILTNLEPDNFVICTK